MKTKWIAGFGIGLCLASVAPQAAQAGVSIDLRFGPSYRRGYAPGPRVYGPYRSYPYPYRYGPPSCVYPPHSVYYGAVTYVESEPQRVVVVQDSSYSNPQVTESSESRSYRLGHDWAEDLRHDVVTWDQFVNHLKSNVTRSSTSDYSEFRRGFLDGYGVNAEAAFDRAYQSARAGG